MTKKQDAKYEPYDRRNHCTVLGAADTGHEGVAWVQWVAHTPAGEIEGCGLYRVRNGLMTYYKDYMNAPAQDDA